MTTDINDKIQGWCTNDDIIALFYGLNNLHTWIDCALDF